MWTADGHREEVHAGTEAYALCYEMADLEKAVAGDDSKRERWIMLLTLWSL